LTAEASGCPAGIKNAYFPTETLLDKQQDEENGTDIMLTKLQTQLPLQS